MFFKHDKYLKLKYYLANLALVWPVVFFYRTNNYYVDFLSSNMRLVDWIYLHLFSSTNFVKWLDSNNLLKYLDEILSSDTQFVILMLAVSYTVLAFIYYFLLPIKKVEPTKGFIIFNYFKKFFLQLGKYLKANPNKNNNILPKISHQEKTTILFIIVKIFFIPLMLNFLFGNYNMVISHLNSLENARDLWSVNSFNVFIYPVIFSMLFLVDTLYFSFGYIFESSLLKNKIRSVEPTLFGWLVALICYPPFNNTFDDYTNWYANDMVHLETEWSTFYLRVGIILLFVIYVWATVALGAKCSNLTNRGIVSSGPYAFVRHPAYISKNLAWWVTVIPIMSIPAFVSMSAWTFVYFLRAMTEENHLIKDPDYQKYVKKVKYRFIPWIF